MAARLCVTEPLIPRGGPFAATEEPELLAEDPHMAPVVRKQRVLRRYGAAKLTLATDGLGSIAPFSQSVLSGLPRGIIGSQIHLHRIPIIRRQFFHFVSSDTTKRMSRSRSSIPIFVMSWAVNSSSMNRPFAST